MPPQRPKRLPTDFFDRLLSNQTDDQINDLLNSLVDEQISPAVEEPPAQADRPAPPSSRAPRRGFHREKIEDSILARDEELDAEPSGQERESDLDGLIPRTARMQSAAASRGKRPAPGAASRGRSETPVAEPPQKPPVAKPQSWETLEVPPELLAEPKPQPVKEPKPRPAVPADLSPAAAHPPVPPAPPAAPAEPVAPAPPAAEPSAPDIEWVPMAQDFEPFMAPAHAEPAAEPPASPIPVAEPPAPVSAAAQEKISHTDILKRRILARLGRVQRKPKQPKLAKYTPPITFAPPKPDRMRGLFGEPAPQKERVPMAKYQRAALVFLLPAFLAFSLFSWYPMLKGLLISFFNYLPTRPSVFVGVANYVRAFQDEMFWRALVFHAGGFCLIVLALGFWLPIILSIFIHELRLGRGMLKFLFFLPFLMPTVPAAILWKWIMDQGFGLLNAVLAFLSLPNPHIGWLTDPRLALVSIALVYIWKNTGWAILIYSAALGNIDETLYEEAEIDGATVGDKLRHVTLPAMRTVIAVMFIITVINTLQLFTEIYIMTNGGPVNSTEVIATYIYRQAFFYMDIGYAAALSMLLLLMLLLITLFRLRRLEPEVG
ncbi:MAG: ABC transporter permease subunit [candidate division FCPU426 bacterium]